MYTGKKPGLRRRLQSFSRYCLRICLGRTWKTIKYLVNIANNTTEIKLGNSETQVSSVSDTSTYYIVTYITRDAWYLRVLREEWYMSLSFVNICLTCDKKHGKINTIYNIWASCGGYHCTWPLYLINEWDENNCFPLLLLSIQICLEFRWVEVKYRGFFLRHQLLIWYWQ